MLILFQKGRIFGFFFVKLKNDSMVSFLGESSKSCSLVVGESSSNMLDYADDVVSGCTQDTDLHELMKKNSSLDFFSGVGQQFDSAVGFRRTVSAYCLKYGYKVRYVKNSKERLTVRCAVDGCPFRIHASCKLKQLDQLFVKSIQLTHSCGGGFRSISSPTINTDLVKALTVNQIRDEPKRKTKDIIKSFRRDYDVDLSYYFAYKG